MLYKIDNDFYIKVQGYYVKVDVNVDGENLDVQPSKDGKRLEVGNTNNYEIYDVRIRAKDIIKELENKTAKKEQKEEEQDNLKNKRNRF